jgi:hypothetical protein
MTRTASLPFGIRVDAKVVSLLRCTAVLTPALMLGGFASAADQTKSPFEKAGSAIIQIAGQAEQVPPITAPQPLELPTNPTPAPQQPPAAPAHRLRSITAISPSYDYDPEGKDPCEHICPRPGMPCPADSKLDCPQDVEFVTLTPAHRAFGDMTYMWCASNLYHNPLYFEDMQLERYGHVKCNEAVQPFVSLGKFGGQLIGLPYQMALDNPHDCRYPLGYYRPGDCAPRKHYRVPLNARAAAVSAPVYAGAVLLLQ